MGFPLDIRDRVAFGHLQEMTITGSTPRNVIAMKDQAAAEEAVALEVMRLLEMEAIVQCRRVDVDVLSPLLVIPKKTSDKVRVCVDLRKVNRVIGPAMSFKMDGIDRAVDLLPRRAFMVTLDIRDGYLQVPMAPESQRLLGFVWRDQVYRYTRLPFGLNMAPRLFTKIVRCLLTNCRRQGINVLAYIDDFLLWDLDPARLVQHRDFLVKALRSVGWEIAPQKGCWEPSRAVTYLGFVINTETSTLMVTPERVASLMGLIERALSTSWMTYRSASQLVGHVISMARAAPMARTTIQELQQRLRHRAAKGHSWATMFATSASEAADIGLLQAMLVFWNGTSFWRPSPVVLLQTDASALGWGAFLPEQGLTRSGRWTVAEATTNSNVRELRAISKALETFSTQLQCRRILIQSDNVTALAYLRKVTGRSDPLFEVARHVCFQICSLRLQIEGSHVRGENNIIADLLSRGQLGAEWCLHPRVWERILRTWGLPDIDRFATPSNAKTRRFNSRGHMARSESPDAFIQDWGGMLNFANPPLPLLSRVFQHVRHCRARAIVIAPVWPSQVWWPTFESMIVGDALPLGNGRHIVDLTRSLATVPEVLRNPAWTFWAALVDGSTTSSTSPSPRQL